MMSVTKLSNYKLTFSVIYLQSNQSIDQSTKLEFYISINYLKDVLVVFIHDPFNCRLTLNLIFA